MSAAPIKLEYELTQNEMRADLTRLMRRGRTHAWSRMLGGSFCFLLLFTGWESHPWWITCLLLFLAVELLFFHRWLIDWASRSMNTFCFVIETDERGLRVVVPYKRCSPIRFWWSRLTRIEESEAGIGLSFDNRNWCELEIPRKAFPDDERRREFLDLASRHLVASRPQGGPPP